jgi:hypothetical protein
MGWETNGKPVEGQGEEFVVYVNAFWIDGDIDGGVYDTEGEACAAAHALIAEMEGLTSDDDGSLDGLDIGELESRIAEQDCVGFAQVAKRDILFR